MRKLITALAALALATAAQAEPPATDAELAAVAELGRINGTALACSRVDIVTKAKALMLARVPKTRTYGEAFENATSEAFRELTAAPESCPVDVVLALRLEAADIKLAGLFPPMVPN